MLDSSGYHPIRVRVKQVLSSKKNSPGFSLVYQQGGQAVVEYVLVLIVSVSMLFLFKGVVKGIDDFMYSYMGEYISCLMEYGELPTQGSTTTNLNQHSQGSAGKTCDAKFNGFTLASGKPSVGSSTTSSANSGAASGRGDTSSKGTSRSTDPKDGSTKDTAKNKSDSGSSGLPSGSGTKSPYTNGSIQRSSGGNSINTADNGASSAGPDKVRVISNDDESDEARRNRLGGAITGNRTIYERSQYRAITGKQLEEVQAQNKTLRAPTSQILSTTDDEYRIGPRKNTFTPPEIKAAVVEQQDDNQMNFGYFMKWLIIAAMGIVIFLFFGSQLMSFMNSQEK